MLLDVKNSVKHKLLDEKRRQSLMFGTVKPPEKKHKRAGARLDTAGFHEIGVSNHLFAALCGELSPVETFPTAGAVYSAGGIVGETGAYSANSRFGFGTDKNAGRGPDSRLRCSHHAASTTSAFVRCKSYAHPYLSYQFRLSGTLDTANNLYQTSGLPTARHERKHPPLNRRLLLP